jgi:hypothetical protein
MKKTIAILIIAIFAFLMVAIVYDANAQAVAVDKNAPQKPSTITIWWGKFMARAYLFPITMALIATIFGIILATVKKDKLLTSIAGQLITIEQIAGSRSRGRLRVESEGIEVIAEKENEKDKEKVSYILPKGEYNTIHALVRYVDFLTEKEKHHRDDELKKAYHPSILMRFRRRIRTVINHIKRVVTDAFNIFFGKKFAGKLGTYEEELKKSGQETVSYMTAADYDSLIDRIVGTRVIILTPKGEYKGVFKDYTKDFIELLDVDYKSNWSITTNRDEGYAKHDRGITTRRNGNNMVITSISPFNIIIRSIAWTEGPQPVGQGDANTTLAVIPPFGRVEINVVTPYFDQSVAPFDRLQLPVQYGPDSYKFIQFNFESTRKADLVMLKSYGILRHRTEKYEPRLLDLNAISESLLTTKEEGFVLKDNPSATPMNIHNGHLTNIPKERMDVREVDDQISQRWAVESYFSILDKKTRPAVKLRYIGSFPTRKTKKILGLFKLISIIFADENRQRDPLIPLIYKAICGANTKKRRRLRKKRMVAKKPNRIFEFLRKSFRIRQPQKA